MTGDTDGRVTAHPVSSLADEPETSATVWRSEDDRSYLFDLRTVDPEA